MVHIETDPPRRERKGVSGHRRSLIGATLEHRIDVSRQVLTGPDRFPARSPVKKNSPTPGADVGLR